MIRALRALALAVGLLALLAPVASAAEPKPPTVESKAWTLVDARTGRVLDSHAAKKELPIASTTKLMTAFVALQELPLGKIVHAAPYHPIYGESLLNLRTGQAVSVRDLLYGLILRSGNDAANDLALAAAGSRAAFVREMNQHAAALGLSHTHYANPVGLDQKGNYSSAEDLATLTRHLLRDPEFAKIADAREAKLNSLKPPRRIETINELLRLAPWTTGVKTGHTFDAGYVLVGSGRKKGVELISVEIGAPTDEARFDGSLDLLEAGFKKYQRRVPVHAGRELASVPIQYTGGELPLRAAQTIAVGTFPGQRVSLDVQAPDQVEGPIDRGAKLGRVTVLVAGKPAGTTALRAGRAVPAAGSFDRVRSFVSDNPILTAVAAFVILLGGALLWRRMGRRRGRGDKPREA